MKNSLLLLFILLFGLFALAQTPVLVSDFSPDGNNTFDSNYPSAQGEDFIVMQSETNLFGQEPMLFKNGEMTVIDLIPGDDWSLPSKFMEHEGYVYFSSRYLEDASALWRTDGTLVGTIPVFVSEDSGSNFIGGIVETESGDLYFTNANKLYKVIGETSEFIIEGVSFETNTELGNTFTPYNTHFAFLRDLDNGELELVEFDGQNLNILGTIPFSFIGSFFGLGVVDGGLVFHVKEFTNESIEGVYTYQEAISVILKKQLDIDDVDPARSYNFNQESQIYLFAQDAWMTVDATDLGPKEVFQNDVDYWLDGFNLAVNGDKFVYQSSDPFGGDPTISISDGTAAGTKVLFSTNSSYLSDFLVWRDLVIFGDGISNGGKPTIYYVNTATEEWGTIYSFTGNPGVGQAFAPVAVIGDRLYFTARVDFDLGTELYYLEDDLFGTIASVDDNIEDLAEIKYLDHNILVQSDLTEKVQVKLYDVSGKLLQQVEGITNDLIPFNDYHGMILFHFNIDGKIFSEIQVLK